MTKLAAQIGFWAAWAETIVGYSYLASYIVLIAIFPSRVFLYKPRKSILAIWRTASA